MRVDNVCKILFSSLSTFEGTFVTKFNIKSAIKLSSSVIVNKITCKKFPIILFDKFKFVSYVIFLTIG